MMGSVLCKARKLNYIQGDKWRHTKPWIFWPGFYTHAYVHTAGSCTRRQQHPCDNKLPTTTNVNRPQITANSYFSLCHALTRTHTHTHTHTHMHTHKLVLHQLGPLAWGSPQWNFHAAIWRSIGDRDLLSGLHVPLEKTRKPEHIGFCKSEEERRGDWCLCWRWKS